MFSFSLFYWWESRFTVFLFYLFSFLIPVFCVLEESVHRDEMLPVQTLSRTQDVLGRLRTADRGKSDDFINVLCSTLYKETINQFFKHISSSLWGRETP